jgi:hypothetical protein
VVVKMNQTKIFLICAYIIGLIFMNGCSLNTRVTRLEAESDVLNERVTDIEICPASAPTRFVDNSDGTICDNQTGLMWEKKLAADGSDGGNCNDRNQENRDIHCVNNHYAWTDSADGDITNPDGTAFTVFLARLNEDIFLGFEGTCFANYCDWSMPRLSELRSLSLTADVCNSNDSCVDPVSEPNWDEYWSFTSASNGTSAWGFSPYLYYPGATEGFFAGPKTSTSAVRAVRRAR